MSSSPVSPRSRFSLYLDLIRWDRPAGWLVGLWPTLSALWIAADGFPGWHLLVVFVLGTFLMRSAGCCVNDVADRDFDKHVKRTAQRPVTTGAVSVKEALSLGAVLALVSFGLVLTTNTAAIAWSVPAVAWWMWLGNLFWVLAYDTEYAMVDRDDDLKIGIKTSAITLGRFDVAGIVLFYLLFIGIWAVALSPYALGSIFYIAIAAALAQAVWHFTLIRTRTREGCFKAFRINHWLGATVFAGIAGSYLVRQLLIN